jgi:hypothetical protein
MLMNLKKFERCPSPLNVAVHLPVVGTGPLTITWHLP